MKKLFSALACLLLLLSLSPPASADAGPKPSVTVTFTGIEEDRKSVVEGKSVN